MRIGMIGLGRMGARMSQRLMRDGHEVVGFDRSDDAMRAASAAGITTAADPAALVASLSAPRVVWFMLPAAVTGPAIDEMAALLGPGDVVVDGGNGRYHDDIARAEALAPRGIHHVDAGVSGGVWGLERGYCLMLGGDDAAIAVLEPVLESLAPGEAAAPRTPSRSGAAGTAERGWLHCGPAGAGHFVKMVHNGIEYGMMAAYAEGLNVLSKANIGSEEQESDAETTPLHNDNYYRFDIDLRKVTEVWRRGSVVTSWLLDLTAEAYLDDPVLSEYAGHVSDSGEGRWTIMAAIEEGVPADVLSAALYARFRSQEPAFSDKVCSAMRYQFGGHLEKSAGG